MADANIKKVTIKKSSLPPIDHDSQKYNIRYRIVSEDKNRNSHWSVVYNSGQYVADTYTGEVSKTENVITAVWTKQEVVTQESEDKYDLFISFDNGPYAYRGTVSTYSFSFVNQGITNYRVRVQYASSKKQIKAAFLVYESAVTPIWYNVIGGKTWLNYHYLSVVNH